MVYKEKIQCERDYNEKQLRDKTNNDEDNTNSAIGENANTGGNSGNNGGGVNRTRILTPHQKVRDYDISSG